MRLQWPWTTEKRADVSYTDTTIQRLVAYASGEMADGLTAGIETAAGHWGRAFGSADLSPDSIIAQALAPHLAAIGRGLVHAGEAVYVIEVGGAELVLLPVTSYNLVGGPNPESWTYDVSLQGPSIVSDRTLAADRVLHLKYAYSPYRPWKGISPIDASNTTKLLLSNLESRLAQEAGGSVGAVIPVPNVSSSAQLQADLRAMQGQLTLVESTVAGWGAGGTSAPQSDYQPRRIGADPPETLRSLRRDTEESILAACGVPVSVLGHSDGSLAREGYRQFLHGVIQPVTLDLSRQIAERFDVALSFNFDRLFASDLSGRARAFQSMVGGGLPVEKAAALAGLMESE